MGVIRTLLRELVAEPRLAGGALVSMVAGFAEDEVGSLRVGRFLTWLGLFLVPLADATVGLELILLFGFVEAAEASFFGGNLIFFKVILGDFDTFGFKAEALSTLAVLVSPSFAMVVVCTTGLSFVALLIIACFGGCLGDSCFGGDDTMAFNFPPRDSLILFLGTVGVGEAWAFASSLP